MRDALSVEATRRANAERVAAAAEHAAATAAEDAEDARAPRAGWRQTPARASPSPELAAPPRGAERRGRTLNAAAEAAELLEELKGYARLRRAPARAAGPARARVRERERRRRVAAGVGGVWRKGGGAPGRAGPQGGFDPKRRPPVRARAGMSYGRQLAGRAPNVGYANRAEAARERLESSHTGPRTRRFPIIRTGRRTGRSPYLDPHSASARSRRASVNAGHQWATPAPQRARRHVASRGGEAEWSRSTHRARTIPRRAVNAAPTLRAKNTSPTRAAAGPTREDGERGGDAHGVRTARGTRCVAHERTITYDIQESVSRVARPSTSFHIRRSRRTDAFVFASSGRDRVDC